MVYETTRKPSRFVYLFIFGDGHDEPKNAKKFVFFTA